MENIEIKTIEELTEATEVTGEDMLVISGAKKVKISTILQGAGGGSTIEDITGLTEALNGKADVSQLGISYETSNNEILNLSDVDVTEVTAPKLTINIIPNEEKGKVRLVHLDLTSDGIVTVNKDSEKCLMHGAINGGTWRKGTYTLAIVVEANYSRINVTGIYE